MHADKKAILNKVLLKPVDSITLLPFLIGISLGLGAWAVNWDSGIVSAASITLPLISAGIYLQRLLLGWDTHYEQAVAEWLTTIESKREKELDDLYRDLTTDGDPRTECLLKDLRTLTKALQSEQSNSAAIGAFDILSDVDVLFQRSVDYLKETLKLWHLAEEMQHASIREEMLHHRELLISEVEKSLENLGAVLGSLKKASLTVHDGNQLAELREELTARLKIAEEVEQKMQHMRQATGTSDEEIYLRHATDKNG